MLREVSARDVDDRWVYITIEGVDAHLEYDTETGKIAVEADEIVHNVEVFRNDPGHGIPNRVEIPIESAPCQQLRMTELSHLRLEPTQTTSTPVA